MMRTMTTAAAVFSVVLCARRATTQQLPLGRALSLHEAISIAEERAARVSIGRLGVRQAEARAVGASVLMPVNPRIAADLRPPVTDGTWRELGYSVVGEIYVDVGGAPAAREREATRAVDAARASLAVARRDAHAQAWAAYVRVKVAEMRLADGQGAIQIARRVLDATRLRGDLGASADIEQSVAALEVAELSAAMEDAKRQLDLRMMDLRDALDLPADELIVLTTALDDPPPAPPDAPLVVRAASVRPELAELRTRVELLGATDQRLQRESYPRVGFYGGIDAAPLSPIFGVLGMSVELPIAQRNQGPRARVARERDTEVARLEIERRRVTREVIAARADYESRRAELRLVRDEALPAAERTLALVQTGWQAGRFDVFRVATASRDVVKTRVQRLDVLEATWLARVELDRAAGGGAL